MAAKMQFVGTELPKPQPSTRKRKTVTVRRAASLKRRKGEWARWPARSTVGIVRRALIAQCGPGFEVKSVSERGRPQVYVRYIGLPTPAPANRRRATAS